MTKYICTPLILAATVIGPTAGAADFPTRMATMGNVDTDIVDSLNARCNSGDGGETLDCNFTTVSIDHQLAPGGIADSVEAFFRQASQRGDVDESVAKLFSADGLCSGDFLSRIDMQGRGVADEYRQRLENVCSGGPSRDNARRLLALESEVQGRTCMVWGTSGDTSFRRAAPGKWTLQSEPSGSCEVYDVVELKCEDNMYNCVYDEHAEYGVTEGEFCEGYSGVVDEGDHYSWQVARNMELNCDFVQFWFD